MKKRILIIFSLLALVLELVLRNSHIYPVFDLELIYMLTIVYLLSGQNRLALIFLLLSSAIVEIIFSRTLGISSAAFFLSSLLVIILYRFNSIFDSERYIIRSAITFLLAVIIKSLLLNFSGIAGGFVTLPVIMANLLVFFLVMLLYERFSIPANVLKN